MAPRYRCAQPQCRAEFDKPNAELIEVTTYESDHEANWVDTNGLGDGTRLRAMCLNPDSQHSMRELDPEAVEKFLEDHVESPARAMISRTSQSWGDHKKTVVRVRTGQTKFRRELLAKYRNVCAFSGEGPFDALEACHLVAFAEQGQHDTDNGLLLRRDLHRLFDLGLIRVNPETNLIVVSEELDKYETYASLHNQPLKVDLSFDQRQWLQKHWELHAS